ncbi:MAG: DUF2267 domain-containing protein [Sphingomonadaceae bacterium]|nr:DUF2267 domain-containing protein [Sphingomonadaceae bacterium]
MSALGLKIIDKAVQDTNIWLDELMDKLDWEDKQRAYRLLRSTLHVLRDRLQMNEAADLAAQLPTLIRGIYYEGWQPNRPPTHHKHELNFIAAIEAAFIEDPNADPGVTARAALAVIADHVSEGEIDDVKSGLPPEIKALWP